MKQILQDMGQGATYVSEAPDDCDRTRNYFSECWGSWAGLLINLDANYSKNVDYHSRVLDD